MIEYFLSYLYITTHIQCRLWTFTLFNDRSDRTYVNLESNRDQLWYYKLKKKYYISIYWQQKFRSRGIQNSNIPSYYYSLLSVCCWWAYWLLLFLFVDALLNRLSAFGKMTLQTTILNEVSLDLMDVVLTVFAFCQILASILKPTNVRISALGLQQPSRKKTV